MGNLLAESFPLVTLMHHHTHNQLKRGTMKAKQFNSELAAHTQSVIQEIDDTVNLCFNHGPEGTFDRYGSFRFQSELDSARRCIQAVQQRVAMIARQEEAWNTVPEPRED